MAQFIVLRMPSNAGVVPWGSLKQCSIRFIGPGGVVGIEHMHVVTCCGERVSILAHPRVGAGLLRGHNGNARSHEAVSLERSRRAWVRVFHPKVRENNLLSGLTALGLLMFGAGKDCSLDCAAWMRSGRLGYAV